MSEVTVTLPPSLAQWEERKFQEVREVAGLLPLYHKRTGQCFNHGCVTGFAAAFTETLQIPGGFLVAQG